MNKSIVGTILLMIMSIDTYANMDLIAETKGNIRIGYQNHQTEENRKDEIALGLKLHVDTNACYGMHMGVTLQSSYGNGKADFGGVPFFDENNDNYATISEAYIRGNFGKTTFTLGRQTIDTPFADSDDVGMIPNTFEAYTLINKDIKDMTIFFSQVQKMSGVDSPIQSKFTNLNGNDGVQILGLHYEGVDNTTLAGWFYNMNHEGTITYLEAMYENDTMAYTYGVTVQYVLQKYNRGEDATIYGLAFSFGSKNLGITHTLAYNKVEGRAAENFFGGGPFLTNAEHNTLKEAGMDGNTFLYTLEWDLETVGAKGVNFAVNIDGHHGKRKDAHEYDMVLGYTYSDTLDFSAVYSHVDDTVEAFNNFRVFVNYAF